jgi:hypothetical protein
MIEIAIRERTTAGLRDATALEPAFRGAPRPQMESFCPLSGNTQPHVRPVEYAACGIQLNKPSCNV